MPPSPPYNDVMIHWPGFRRLWKRACRRIRHQWIGLQVTFHGNLVTRKSNLTQAIPRPILLLHGFGSTRRSLEILEQRLRADGFEVFSLRLGGIFGTLNTRRIGDLGREALAKLASLRARYPLGKFTIIGHSKGGLLGRYLVSCLPGDEHIQGVITLGTPHQGYPYRQLKMVTRWGVAMASVREMRPESKFFAQLRSAPVSPAVQCVSICSVTDHVVPPVLCRWELAGGGAAQLIELPGVSHTDYLLKPKVYEAIRGLLK